MIKFIRLFFFLTAFPVIAFSLSSADFNKKMAEKNQANSPSLSQAPCNCSNTVAPTPTQIPNTQTPAAPPVYYAPAASFNANPAASPTAPTTSPTPPTGSLWGAANSDPLIIAH